MNVPKKGDESLKKNQSGDKFAALVRDVREIRTNVKLLENWIQQKNEKRDHGGLGAFLQGIIGGVVVAFRQDVGAVAVHVEQG